MYAVTMSCEVVNLFRWYYEYLTIRLIQHIVRTQLCSTVPLNLIRAVYARINCGSLAAIAMTTKSQKQHGLRITHAFQTSYKSSLLNENVVTIMEMLRWKSYIQDNWYENWLIPKLQVKRVIDRPSGQNDWIETCSTKQHFPAFFGAV